MQGTTLPLLAILLAGQTAAAGAGGSAVETIRLEFSSSVQNIEFLRSPLLLNPREGLRVCADLQGEVRHGEIPFRLPEEEATSAEHFLPFLVVYGDTPPPRLLLDLDQDGAIGCDELVALVRNPGDPGRVFRTLVLGGNGTRPRSRYRLSLPAVAGPSDGEWFSIDLVDVPVARWPLDGGAPLWVLFDGNQNGVYDHKFGDGILIDATGAGRLSTDPYAGDFFSYNLPLRLPWGDFQVVEVDSQGRFLTLARMREGDAARFGPFGPGDATESIECKGIQGRSIKVGGATGRHQLLHFWLSQCGACEREIKQLAPVLERIGEDRLAAVGVSLDVTEKSFREFIEAHRPDWPQCFVGAMFWDNPFAVRFGVAGPSDLVLLGPDGQVVAHAHGLEELLPALEELFPRPPAGKTSSGR